MRATFAVIVALGAWLLAAPLVAHHAFSSEFDISKPLKLRGTLTKWEMINPHSWFHIDVKNPDGTVTNWMVECGSPNIMLRRGFTKRSLEVGSDIVVQGYQAKNGTMRANGSSVTFSDGKKLFVGGSNPDDPNGGKQ